MARNGCKMVLYEGHSFRNSLYLSCSSACLFSCHLHSFSWSIYLLLWWATPTQELPKSKMNGWDRYIVQYNTSFDMILPQARPNFYSFHIRQWIVGKNCLDCGARHLSRREIEAAKPLFRKNGYRRKGLGSQANHVGRYLLDKYLVRTSILKPIFFEK